MVVKRLIGGQQLTGLGWLGAGVGWSRLNEIGLRE